MSEIVNEVWYLTMTLFVLLGDGTVDERQLYSVKQENELSCNMEAKAHIDLFNMHLEKDHIRRYSLNDTYMIRLNGTLVGFEVGCERRPKSFDQQKLPPTHFREYK